MKNLRANIEILSEQEIQNIHKASLEILERVGIHMPNDECLRRCEKIGARIDYVRGVMRIPVGVMDNLLQELKKVTPEEEDPTVRQPLTGGISTQVFVVDYKTRQRRRGLTDDILKGIALVKHLKNIPRCNAVTVPSDVDPRITDIHSYLQIYKYSEKHGDTYILTPQTAHYIMDMTEAIGRKTGYLFETISPFRLRKETLEMALLFADRGHYLGIGPMIMGGSTAPITPAGIMTSVNAEVLASLFCVYALTGNLMSFYGHGSHATDPRTLLCSFGSPSQALIGVATAQMTRYYGLPGSSNSALSDALMPDFQCGFEKAANAIFSCLAGAVFIGCQGIVGADQGYSHEQLLIDNEWLDSYNFIISGFEATTETIAQDMIEDLGIGGVYIAEEHTVQHMRQSWWPSKLFERVSFEKWKTDGSIELLDRAHEMVENYTEGYKNMEPVLPGTQVEELERIYRNAVSAIVQSS